MRQQARWRPKVRTPTPVYQPCLRKTMANRRLTFQACSRPKLGLRSNTESRGLRRGSHCSATSEYCPQPNPAAVVSRLALTRPCSHARTPRRDLPGRSHQASRPHLPRWHDLAQLPEPHARDGGLHRLRRRPGGRDRWRARAADLRQRRVAELELVDPDHDLRARHADRRADARQPADGSRDRVDLQHAAGLDRHLPGPR